MPSPTPTVERAPSLQPSATLLPYIPTQLPDLSIGFSDPTSAALVAEGEPSQEPDLVISTASHEAFPLQFFADDGRVLQVQFFGAANRPAAGILLLHDYGQADAMWFATATGLQTAGYNVFVPDLPRIQQASETQVDWATVLNDIITVTRNIEALVGINSDSLMLMGAGTGANLAIISCAVLSECVGVVAISPRSGLVGLEVDGALPAYQGRSALLVSGDDDVIGTSEADRLNGLMAGQHSWQRYSNGGRGAALLGAQPGLVQRLVEWARRYMPG